MDTNKKQEYVAKTFAGLEEVLKTELTKLGAENVNIAKRAVTFIGDKEMLYKANLCLRTALRILVPVVDFNAKNEEEFYQKIKRHHWEKYLSANHTFAIDCVIGRSEIFTHNHYMALKAKDAIVDRFNEKYNARPSIDLKNPQLRIHVHINEDKCSISLDSSGDTLNKRGYRSRTDIAPLNEVLAAGMILLANWNDETTFLDPMCGSGTILIEAAMIAMDMAPCISRKEFGFENWNDFDADIWEKVRNDAKRNSHNPKNLIIGNDISKKAVAIAKQNIENANLQKYIKIANRTFQEFEPEQENITIVTNPPYGERIVVEEIEKLYAEIGDTLKKKYKGCSAWILSGSTEGLKSIGLHPSKKLKLINGAIECKFHRYDMYSGSIKQKKAESNNIE